MSVPKEKVISSIVPKPNLNITDEIAIDIPKHLELYSDFQIELFKIVRSKIDSELTITTIKHNQYAERYIFNTEPDRTIIDLIYSSYKLLEFHNTVIH